jgi:hypothetical protein
MNENALHTGGGLLTLKKKRRSGVTPLALWFSPGVKRLKHR